MRQLIIQVGLVLISTSAFALAPPLPRTGVDATLNCTVSYSEGVDAEYASWTANFTANFTQEDSESEIWKTFEFQDLNFKEVDNSHLGLGYALETSEQRVRTAVGGSVTVSAYANGGAGIESGIGVKGPDFQTSSGASIRALGNDGPSTLRVYAVAESDVKSKTYHTSVQVVCNHQSKQ